MTDNTYDLIVLGSGSAAREGARKASHEHGSRVAIVNHGPQIAARDDKEAADELQAALEDEGIEVILNAGVDSVSRESDGVDAVVQGRTLHVSDVLLASGRVPNIEHLRLDAI